MTIETAIKSEATEDESQVVLVVDLDGTLCRTDTLHEALLDGLIRRPLDIFKWIGWLSDGKARFKARIADTHVLPADALPFNSEVVETIRAARAAGQRTALVSASDHRQVTAIAEQSGLFNEAYGSADGRNLKGAEKAAFLTARYGAKKFDYIGDAPADIPVWAAARTAITVGARASLRRAAETANPQTLHMDLPGNRTGAMLRALRPHQWSKNLLLFLPMFAAHDLSNVVPVLFGFLSFCLTASAIYIVNDLMDLPADRAHPRKSRRPFAAGDLSASSGLVMAVGLLMAALFLGLLTGQAMFLVVLALYLATTFLYSLYLKRKLLVDVLTLAGLYSVRILAGGAAAGVVFSPWMLGFSMFLFLSLAAVKRQAELVDLEKTGRAGIGRAYEITDLPVIRSMAMSAGHAAVLVLALYISSDDVQQLYAQPTYLWLICPLLLYWCTRMVMKTHRGVMTDDPIVFAVTDHASQTIGILCALILVAAKF